MAKAVNPPSFYYDPNFTAEITAKMQVPKRIKVAGSNDDDEDITPKMPWQPEKIDMRVPDRILVAGQDSHIETSAPPRELIIENTVMPPDPGLIRVHTPPRVITLDEHYFPSAADNFYEQDNEDVAIQRKKDYRDVLETTQNNSFMNDSIHNPNDFSMVSRSDPFLKPDEEVIHLRKQLVKMNRRIMNLERENAYNKQRNKMVAGVVAAYFIMKVFFWMNRNS